MLSRERAEAFAAEWVESWNLHDLERVMSHYADHVEFHSPFAARLAVDSGGVIRGAGALRAYFSAAFARSPDLHFDSVHVLTGVESLVIHYRNVTRRVIAAEMMRLDETEHVVFASAHYLAQERLQKRQEKLPKAPPNPA